MLGVLLAALFAASTPPAAACPTGLFQSGSQQVVITSRPNGSYRYTFTDGRRGDVGAAGSPLQCSAGQLVGDGQWTPVNVRMTGVSFQSHGACSSSRRATNASSTASL